MSEFRKQSKSDVRSLFFLLFSLFTFLLFSGCNDGQYDDLDGPKAKAGYGLVTVTPRGAPSRTVLPLIAFGKEEYFFTNLSNGETQAQDPIDGYFTLSLGVWQVSVKMYIKMSDANPAAIGTSEPFNVTNETIAKIVIQLSDTMTGTGSFSYSITYPDNSQIITFTLENIFSWNDAVLETIEESEHVDGNIVLSGTKVVSAGYNYLTLELKEDGTEYRTAGANEVVFIYYDANSEYSVIFTKDDFSHIHQWGNWDSSATEIYDGTEIRACIHDSSHIQERIAYATGTPGLYFEITDTADAYRLIQSSPSNDDVFIPAMHRPDINSPYLPVTEIASNAFQSSGGPGMPPLMSSMTSVTIPATVTAIGTSNIPGNNSNSNVFTNCSELKSITVNSGNPNYSSEGGVLYDKARTQLIAAPRAIERIDIPESVTAIGDNAASSCNRLRSITLPASVTTIGNSAFSNCNNLTSINIPANVTTIGQNAFSSCGFVSIEIPSSVTTIGSYAFSSCNNLISINIPASVETIGQGAFSWCNSLTGITVDGGNPNYTSDNGILYDKAKTQLLAVPRKISGTISIPSGVTSIGESAFSGCSDLDSITLPNSVTSIGGNAFNGCNKLTSFTIPDSVTSISYGAFSWCNNLTSINIPAGVETIGNGVFSGCSNLTSITVDGGNPNYTSEGGILYNKSKTELLAYPAASGDVTILSTVTSIGQGAFSSSSGMNSTGLISVTIPASVKSIGSSAFSNCNSLISVTFAAGSDISGRNSYGQDNFGDYAFPGGINGNNLKTAYLAYDGGAGTYTRTANGDYWTKQ